VQHRVSARDAQRIQAAVARGAILPGRVAFYEAAAARGEDISFVDVLWGPGSVAAASRTGIVAAAASPEGADYERLFGGRAPRADDGGSEYGALFGSVEQGQRRADEVRAARRTEVAAMSDDELYESLFPGGVGRTTAPRAGAGSQKPARDPLTAQASGRAGKHGRGTPAGTWSRTSRPYPPRAD
jgi:hypothetical protein